MKKAGLKKDLIAVLTLTPLTFPENKPLYFPHLSNGDSVVCGVDFGLGETLFICENFSEMNLLYTDFRMKFSQKIQWYLGQTII
ncbi:MAG: hypothetical protein ACOZBH_04915 [Patescibacteria group bacterium]